MKKISFILCIVIPIIDIFSKVIVKKTLALGEEVPILGHFLRFTHIENTGVVFGFFSQTASQYIILKNILLLIFGIAILYFLILEYKKSQKNLYFMAYSFIIGGALGNILERLLGYVIYDGKWKLFYGKVVDFIDIGIGEHRWYTFNISDSFICIGVCLLILATFKYPIEKR